MTTPIIPAWAVETCPGDSTDHTDVIDAYGPSAYPAWGVSLNLAQRSSSRDGITLHDPAEVVMCAEHPVTRMTEGDLRALARDALALADQLATIDYAPAKDL